MKTAERNSAGCADAPVPLRPHRYPAWLVFFTALLLGAILYSATLIPPYLDAFVALHRAKAAVAAGDRAASEARLLDVLHAFPSSKPARIEIAVLLLANPAEAQQRRGLGYLEGIKLGKYEWQRVSAVLPEKFRNAFSPVTK
ncbi:MAG TPA: hypothetical protein VKP67_25230 [Xanthobacteraceae bacterium]|nr:hypothetical protein [Xanthobacteraceae bacterium]